MSRVMCPTCWGAHLVNGQNCPDCGGRGWKPSTVDRCELRDAVCDIVPFDQASRIADHLIDDHPELMFRALAEVGYVNRSDWSLRHVPGSDGPAPWEPGYRRPTWEATREEAERDLWVVAW